MKKSIQLAVALIGAFVSSSALADSVTDMVSRLEAGFALVSPESKASVCLFTAIADLQKNFQPNSIEGAYAVDNAFNCSNLFSHEALAAKDEASAERLQFVAQDLAGFAVSLAHHITP
jgi:hypothetical protein